MNAWLENAVTPGRHTLLDLGQASEVTTQSRAESLLSIIGRRNFLLVGMDRMLVRIPPTKVGRALASFPEIRPKELEEGYCWCTHFWNA